MKTLKSTLLATAAFSAMALSATAGSYAPPVVAPPVIAPLSAAHDWSGGYVGLSYAADLNGNLGSDLAALRLGYNFESGNLVYGGEFTYGSALAITGATFADIGVRVGYKASDNLLLIAKLGYGSTSVPTPYYLVQVGGEYAVNDHFSLTGAYETWIDPANVFLPTSQLVIGVNYGF